MANPWDNDPIIKAAPSKSGMPWDNDPIVKPAEAKAGVVEDVAKSAGSGLVRGATGIAGAVGDFADYLGKGADAAAPYVVSGINRVLGTKFDDSPISLKNPVAEAIGSQSINRAIDNATGAPVTSYKPQTVPGEYARTIGEFAPGAIVPGGVAAKVVGGVLAPAVASETAGQAFKGSALEGPARLVGALGAGGIAAMASRPATAEAAVAAGMRGVDDATVTAAGQLMQEAQARGINLTWPEAIAQASGGGARGLTNMQRVVEGSQGGGDVMGAFMAQRPAQVEAAARNQFGTVSPPLQQPQTIGPAIGEAAESVARDARAVRSAATADAYGRAANDVVAPEAVQGIITQLDEIIARAGAPELAAPAQQLRDRLIARQATPGTPATRTPVTDPNTGRVIRYETTPAVPGEAAVPHTNVGRLDEVYGSARDQFTGPAPVGQTGTEARASRYAAEALEPLDAALRNASPALREGREIHQRVTRDFINPLMQGPIGKLADRDIGTREAINALFPANPLPGSAPEIVRSVGALAERNPGVARQLVRAHIESVFNEATQALQSGANQFGGAGFAAVLRGNTQQAENLAAAIQGVAGPQALQGFDRFLDIMSATGQRQRIGSQTAFNQETQDILRRGGAVGEAANVVATGGIKLPGRIKEAYEQWRLGRNTEQIAQLFTDPNAINLFRALGRAAPGSAQAEAMAARLGALAAQGRTTTQPRP
ncbi:hypothetical protein J2X48_000706 [Bosea sp. BE271]|uniref:hypothetical protein n=1 Tax=Bosea TaxID=85413 RepID=UPI002860C85E|nr:MULTISPECIES: hypothetical protein [Bosea]MDR6826490.1 hypothetical protein [Bosea robiniae]MDR6893200.1 hypothetical protein [Bosea sp. BE109]MDR7137101.1 hypothetical protein [Bosea sp. BE168]MDR7173800.1 hypothetical protein [Bosea sp. BE271]